MIIFPLFIFKCFFFTGLFCCCLLKCYVDIVYFVLFCMFLISAIKKLKNETNVSFWLSMVELDHRRSVAKTLVNKLGLNT